MFVVDKTTADSQCRKPFLRKRLHHRWLGDAVLHSGCAQRLSVSSLIPSAFAVIKGCNFWLGLLEWLTVGLTVSPERCPVNGCSYQLCVSGRDLKGLPSKQENLRVCIFSLFFARSRNCWVSGEAMWCSHLWWKRFHNKSVYRAQPPPPPNPRGHVSQLNRVKTQLTYFWVSYRKRDLV